MEGQDNGFFKAYSLEITVLIAAILIASTILVSVNNVASVNKEILAKLTSGAQVAGGAGAGAGAGGATQQPQKVNVLVGNAPVKGSATAKVTIVEFSDPSCPFCAAANGDNQEVIDYLKTRDPSWVAPLPNIMRDYVDTGKVKIAFKYYPGHGKGIDAMKIMWCSEDQGKFWEVQDAMFAHQELMEASDVAGLKKLATDLGVNSASLDACLASGKYNSRLQSDAAEGAAAGLDGTPTFYVNGMPVGGAASYPSFKQVIDVELAAVSS